MIVDEQNFRTLSQKAQDEFKNKKIIILKEKPADEKAFLIHLNDKDLYCYIKNIKDNNVI